MAVPLDTPSSRQTQRALRALDAERKRDSQEKITGWTVVWTLFAFKMATICIIWWAANGTSEANAYITVTTWYWMVIPAVAISGFVGYRLRLRRVRKRAAELRKAEFADDALDREPWVLTDDEIEKLMALEARHHGNDRPGEG